MSRSDLGPILGPGFSQFIHKMIDCGSESGEDLAETS